MQPCKFAEKVWNAQKAGAQGVRCTQTRSCQPFHDLLPAITGVHVGAGALQVIVVNYEDKHTTMEAPNDQDESVT